MEFDHVYVMAGYIPPRNLALAKEVADELRKFQLGDRRVSICGAPDQNEIQVQFYRRGEGVLLFYVCKFRDVYEVRSPLFLPAVRREDLLSALNDGFQSFRAQFEEWLSACDIRQNDENDETD